MAAKSYRVKVKGEETVDKVRQLELVLGVKEEDIVKMAIDQFWDTNVDKVRNFLSRLNSGTALFNGKDEVKEEEKKDSEEQNPDVGENQQ